MSNFLSLPREVILIIFEFCDSASLLRSRRVCKSWHDFIANDSIWQSRVSKQFAIKSITESENYLALFKKLVTEWNCFDNESHYPQISIDSSWKFFRTAGDSPDTYYLPVRGKLAVKKGRHFFEIKILDNRSRSLFCAIGVGDESFPTTKSVSSGYTSSNNGIGWYSHGHIYHFGNGVVMDGNKGFGIQDRVGFLLDMDQGLIVFYKNGEKVSEPLSIYADPEKINISLYPIILSERGLVARIESKASGLDNVSEITPKVPEITIADLHLDEKISTLIAMGFTFEKAKKALLINDNDTNRAANYLLEGN